ncbi:AraC family transcriptional regulator [Acidisoma cellulosilytica]|uniref:AraC family transcriptional regulator n=1 Tax=Acidisoma cellulosilyticum TaxID=2802395 RepID=A0A963Z7B9_9PROT|nr:AraC family transcriptional regulator [Acidisoma cellulosilyticum]MCB8883197.1 AraC family transcriptional regulator [Acidisoma cellulosilyticum]
MTETLENLTNRPEHEPQGATAGDLLSHVLAQIHLTGDQVFSQTLAQKEALTLGPDEAHIIIVTAGMLEIRADNQASDIIQAGDLLLLPRGLGEKQLVALKAGTTVALCRFWFNPDTLQTMVFALPQHIHIRRAEGADWIEGMLHFVLIEAGDSQPGGALMISRIIDLLVIRTLRTWVHRGETSGWLGGLADARIARSLKAIHEQPMQRWSVDGLADLVGMSRSSFSERFTALVGRSPVRYQNEWRLTLARDMLKRRNARVGEIGLRIGYESEAAFSRAYKQFFGHAPRVEYALKNEKMSSDQQGGA